MKLEATHDIIVLGPDFDKCKAHVLRFLDKTPLVQYDTVQVDEKLAVSAESKSFWERVEQGINANREALAGLLGELKGYGFHALPDLLQMEQGFQSKILHTAAHLLDGFFGIDTCLYSLPHDSHWLLPAHRQEIKASPADYWLLQAKGAISVKSGGKPAFLRTFEK